MMNGNSTRARRRIPRSIWIGLASLPCAIGDASAADFAEAGFETPALSSGGFDYNPNDPTPGQSAWTYGGASGIASIPGAFGPLDAPEGNQVAFLQSFGSGTAPSVCQSLTGLAPGVTHFFSALLAQRTGCPSCVGPVDVEFQLDSNVLLTVNGADIPTGEFARFAALFTPAAATGTLCIVAPPKTGLFDATNLADDVHVGISGIFSDSFESAL